MDGLESAADAQRGRAVPANRLQPRTLDLNNLGEEDLLPPAQIPNAEAPVTMGAMNTMFRDYLAPVMKISQAQGRDFKKKSNHQRKPT
eukprot:1452018-Pyramimonas_sp.AAC.1